MSKRHSLVACVWLAACSSAAAPLSRVPDPRDNVGPAPPAAAPVSDTWAPAQRVFETRCILCHGCYDAPCQLKLESYPGVARGASPVPVYDGSRLTAAAPTRLGIDARLVSEWRAKGFHTVIPDAPNAERNNSLLMRMLALKAAHPITPEIDVTKEFTFELDREASCVTGDKFDEFAKQHPYWGMPYGLPNVEPEQYSALESWVQAGAPNGPATPLPAASEQAVREWETYLNEATPKRKLIARYVYEHLFLASLYFKDVDDVRFFRLVRSRTPSGYPVDEVPSRRPFDDPGKGQFFYRLLLRDGARLAKTHMPYALDKARLARYRKLFDEPEYEVSEQPSYEPAVASNPFRSFGALPVGSRYQFLLDEAEYFMMGFIKGPVCRGQVALNVIQERFWIAFLDPDGPFATKLSEQLSDLQTQFELPAKAGSNALPLRWFAEADQHGKYVQARNALWASAQKGGTRLNVDLIWNGDGKNSNAGLTVLRHFDSATVVRGFVGGPPKTAWVVDYPLFERIHYLLVAGFDVFGNVGHQIMTRLYMDFLRMEGEANYLSLLPKARRTALADYWYRDVSKQARKRVQTELVGGAFEPNVTYKGKEPEFELDAKLQQRLAPALAHTYDIRDDDSIGQKLLELATLFGPAASAMPELAFLEVETGQDKMRYYTIMRDSAHSNVAKLFDEVDRRILTEDALRVVPGFLGAYPNALFHVRDEDLTQFVNLLAAVQTGEDYAALRGRFGVLRYSQMFWPASDRMHAAYRAEQPLMAGSFDYNRLQAP